MGKLYWYDTCSFCGEGNLDIFHDTTNDRLYLHCGECEHAWLDPKKTLDLNASFVAVSDEYDFEAEVADFETIRRFGWEEYACHSEDYP